MHQNPRAVRRKTVEAAVEEHPAAPEAEWTEDGGEEVEVVAGDEGGDSNTQCYSHVQCSRVIIKLCTYVMLIMSLLRPFRLPPTIAQLLSSHRPSSSALVTVNAHVKSIRRQKRVAFAQLTDGTTANGLQAVFGDAALAKRLPSFFSFSLTFS